MTEKYSATITLVASTYPKVSLQEVFVICRYVHIPEFILPKVIEIINLS